MDENCPIDIHYNKLLGVFRICCLFPVVELLFLLIVVFPKTG